MNRRTCWILALSATLAAPLSLAAQSLDTTAINAEFARSINAASPGCAVAIAQNGRTLFERAYGMADLEHDIPNTVNTIFEAGSVSKQFTAAAVLILAERGKLSLDDDIRKWFPELHGFGEVITVRNLLQHTSGLRDWGALAWIEGWPRGTRVTSERDVLEMMSRQRTLNHPVGAQFSYTNTGYNLAVLLVERASHESFPAFTRRELFEPIGMTHTQWRDNFATVVKGRAQAYSMGQPPNLLPVQLDMPFENAYGNGGLLTTVGDLLKWNDALTAHHVGSPDVSKIMETPGTLNNGKPITYGAGLFVRLVNGVPEIGHDGSTAGYRSYLARYPVQHVSMAMLCNQGFTGNTPTLLAWNSVRSIVPFDFPAITDHNGPPPAARPTLTTAQLQQFVGTWHSEEMLTPLEIKRVGDTLRLVRRPGLEGTLLPAAGAADRFTTGAAELRFERDAAGNVARLFVSLSRALNVPYSRAP